MGENLSQKEKHIFFQEKWKKTYKRNIDRIRYNSNMTLKSIHIQIGIKDSDQEVSNKLFSVCPWLAKDICSKTKLVAIYKSVLEVKKIYKLDPFKFNMGYIEWCQISTKN